MVMEYILALRDAAATPTDAPTVPVETPPVGEQPPAPVRADQHAAGNAPGATFDAEAPDAATWLGEAAFVAPASDPLTFVAASLDGFAELRLANAARHAEWWSGHQATLSYRGNELAGEVGEACNVLKKLDRERLGLVGSRDTVEHLAEELADVIICVDLVAMDLGIDLLSAVRAKFNATSSARGLATLMGPPAAPAQ